MQYQAWLLWTRLKETARVPMRSVARHPIRPKWLAFWASLLAVFAVTYTYIAASGDWSAALTNQTMALVVRFWWVGLIMLAFLTWLLVHFAVRILPEWWRQTRSHDPEN